MPQQDDLPVALQLARWVLRDWMAAQVRSAAGRLGPYVQAQAPYYWRNDRSATTLATNIRGDVRWLLAQASWQLSSPTDQQVLRLASSLLGGTRGAEVELLADAVIIAGAPKNSDQRKRAEQRAARTVGGLAVRSLLYDL